MREMKRKKVFTFHIVQIKRAKLAVFPQEHLQFTFHIVQIKRAKSCSHEVSLPPIYIPHSSDKTSTPFSFPSCLQSIYIPHSSDIPSRYIRVSTTLFQFTFHIVQIKLLIIFYIQLLILDLHST